MPTKPRKPCRHPGCPALTDNGWCERHASERPKQKETLARKIRNTRLMKRVARQARYAHPLCSDPFGAHIKTGVLPLAEQTHHVVSLADDPSRAVDEDNLMPLCAECHEEIERRKGLRT